MDMCRSIKTAMQECHVCVCIFGYRSYRLGPAKFMKLENI